MHPHLARPHLATLLDDFRRYGSDRAVVNHTGNRSLPSTYAELAELSARFAAEYGRRGIVAGDRVLLWGQNSAAWIAAFYGCILRGILVVPLDASGDSGFALRVTAETAPRLLVGDPSLLQKLQPSDVPALALDATGLPAPDYIPDPGLNRSTPLQIIFTSGTTSEPKGIVHTHGNVLASLDPIEREIARYRRYERPFHPLRFLHTLPLSHVFGQFMGLWVPPLLAAEVHFETRLDAPRVVQLIHNQRISVLAAVPRVLELLRSHLTRLDPTLANRLKDAAHDSALRRWRFRRQHRLFGWKFWAFVCGGATLPEDLEQFWTRLGFALIQGYGMTETTALVTLNHPFHTARGSIGKPLAGREVKVAEDGEILVRGDSIAETEWRAGGPQQRTADEGWLRTGDLAAQNDRGELVFAGRKSDVIVTAAGLNVHPQDLEAALARHPGVREACAFAYDGGAGPQPAAALLMSDDSKADAAVTQANVTLADYQQIRRWLLWPDPDFPRTTTGKVKRREVAARSSLAFRTTGEVSAGDDPLVQTLRAMPGTRLDKVTDASRLSEDIGLDSLGMVELQDALEHRFAVEIPEDAWQHTRTVSDLRRLIIPDIGTRGTFGDASASASITEGSAHRRVEADATDYPRWSWSAPVRWLRIAFLECVSIPLTRLLLDPRIDRPQTIPIDKPLLIAANHVTAFDLPLVLAALQPRIRRHTAVAMAGGLLTGWRHARAERHGWLRLLTPLAYWLTTALFNVFPLPQGAGFRRSFAHAGAAMDYGMSVVLFPEGRRSADETLGRFQSGIGLLVRESGAPVLPVVIVGLGELKLRKRRWFRPSTVTIHVADPITMRSGETPQDFTMRLEARFRELLRQP